MPPKKPTNNLLKNNPTQQPSSSGVSFNTSALPAVGASSVPRGGTILMTNVPQTNTLENAPKRTVQILSGPPQQQQLHTGSPSTTTAAPAKRGRKKKSDTVKKDLFVDTASKSEAPIEPVTSSIIQNNSTTPTKLVCPSTPTRKKKNRPTFAVAKIKRIIQSDEEIGKISAVVPILISRALELFIQDLVVTSSKITKKKNAGTVTTAHLKETIEAEDRFDFLRNKVKNIQLLSTSNDAVMSDDDESTGKKGKKKKSKKAKEDVESDEDDESLGDSNDESSLPIIGQSELPVVATTASSSMPSQSEQQVKQEPTSSQSYYNPYQTPTLPTSSSPHPQSSHPYPSHQSPYQTPQTQQPYYPPQQHQQQYPPHQYHQPYPPQHYYPPQHQSPYQQPPPNAYPPQSHQPPYPPQASQPPPHGYYQHYQ